VETRPIRSTALWRRNEPPRQRRGGRRRSRGEGCARRQADPHRRPAAGPRPPPARAARTPPRKLRTRSVVSRAPRVGCASVRARAAARAVGAAWGEVTADGIPGTGRARCADMLLIRPHPVGQAGMGAIGSRGPRGRRATGPQLHPGENPGKVSRQAAAARSRRMLPLRKVFVCAYLSSRKVPVPAPLSSGRVSPRSRERCGFTGRQRTAD